MSELRELSHPTIDTLYVTPSDDGLTLKPEVFVAVKVADAAARENAQQAVFKALRLSVFIEGQEDTPGGGSTGHEGGYPDGFHGGPYDQRSASRTGFEWPDRRSRLQRLEADGETKLEPLAAFDFVRLRMPDGDYPSLSWPAAGVALTALTGSIVRAQSRATSRWSACPQRPCRRRPGTARGDAPFVLDVADPAEHGSLLVQLPVEGVLSDAQRRSVAALVYVGKLAVVSGVLCQQGGNAWCKSVDPHPAAVQVHLYGGGWQRMTSSTRSGLGLAAGWRWVTLWLAIGWAALGQALPPAHAQGGATPGEPWLTMRVVHPTGAPVPEALVYLGGCDPDDYACQPRRTDQQGLLRVSPSALLAQPVALALQEARAAGQDEVCCQGGRLSPCSIARGSWSYRVYLTNLVWSGEGDPRSVAVQQDGTLELRLQRLHPLNSLRSGSVVGLASQRRVPAHPEGSPALRV